MLKGERVVLRAVEREDLPKLWQFNNDLEVELAGGGDPPMPQPLARLQAEFDERSGKGGRDGGNFVIEVEGKVIGGAALFRFDELARCCELGIGIGDKEYWGRGYGREAVALLLDYAFRYRNLNRVFLSTMATNERAVRCYRACGFVEEGRLREQTWSNGRYIDVVYMGVLRGEWERGQDKE